MKELKSENFETESHSENVEFIFDKTVEEGWDFIRKFRLYYRFLRMKKSLYFKKDVDNLFTKIVFLTLDCPPFTKNSFRKETPLEYIVELQKQYPDKDIRVLIPIVGVAQDFNPKKKLVVDIDGKLRVLEKTSISFSFFLQNRKQKAIVYKYPKNNTNVQVYGIYSPSFSYCRDSSEVARLQFLAPFLKSARIAIENLGKISFKPNLVHCENIPFFLGMEFEPNKKFPIKVLQVVKDFTQIDVAKQEAFWALINLVDKASMRKICKDIVVKKYVAELFKLHNTQSFYPIKECLNYIYENYFKFRRYIDKGQDIEENIIFSRLNSRILQLFPHITHGEDQYFNTMLGSIIKSDYWAVVSKTYYEEVFAKPELSGKMFETLIATNQKSGYISYGLNSNAYPLEQTREIYQGFNLENFRTVRGENKKALVKEFSEDRIKTSFVDITLFKDENIKIVGSLDSFYDSPLLFVYSGSEIFANGLDIVFNTILKLFELHKNIQVIFCVKNGLKTQFVNNWVDFLSDNRYLNGRWVFVDAEINLPKFLAASDMILLPRRANMVSTEHFLAMHYGCVPIVSRSGILNDTIADVFDDINLGCGFKTKSSLLTNDDSNELFLTPVLKALNIYQNNHSGWNLLVKNCLNKPCGWSFEILEKYNKIYESLS